MNESQKKLCKFFSQFFLNILSNFFSFSKDFFMSKSNNHSSELFVYGRFHHRPMIIYQINRSINCPIFWVVFIVLHIVDNIESDISGYIVVSYSFNINWEVTTEKKLSLRPFNKRNNKVQTRAKDSVILSKKLYCFYGIWRYDTNSKSNENYI